MLTKNDLEQIKEIVTDVVTDVVTKEIQASEERVLTQVGNFIHDTIVPQLDEKADKKDLARLEEKVDLIQDKIDDLTKEVQKTKAYVGLFRDQKAD